MTKCNDQGYHEKSYFTTCDECGVEIREGMKYKWYQSDEIRLKEADS